MRKLATSTALALLNLLLAGAAEVVTHMNLSDAAIVIEMVFLPLVLLATLVFVIRDLIGPATRLSAVIALFLSDRTLARCLGALGNDYSNNAMAKAARRYFERSNPGDTE